MDKKTPEDRPLRRPDLYTYIDHDRFLRDWFRYQKNVRAKFSLQEIAKSSGVAPSLLTMVMKGDRRLTKKALERILPHLGLSKPEQNHLALLRDFTEPKSPEDRIETLKKMNRSFLYKQTNPVENEAYEYYSKWYYVAIREMTVFPDFELDPKWIQDRLQKPLPLVKIEQALKFLIKHKYISLRDRDQRRLDKFAPDCDPTIMRIALSEFHRNLLTIASDSIQEVPREKRDMQSYTLAITEEQFPEVKQIIADAMDRLDELTKKNQLADTVYHVEMLAFPLTKLKDE